LFGAASRGGCRCRAGRHARRRGRRAQDAAPGRRRQRHVRPAPLAGNSSRVNVGAGSAEQVAVPEQDAHGQTLRPGPKSTPRTFEPRRVSDTRPGRSVQVKWK
jgi:hypothetical protein